MRIASRRMAGLARSCSSVGHSAATRFRATSKMSKLRSVASGRHVDLAVGDHRHRLLGEPAMRAQRLGQAREIVPRRAGAEHLVPVEITTMSPMRSAGSSKRRAGLVALERDVDALDRLQPASSASASAPVRQIDGRERAERAVMRHVRIGDRQDDARLARRRATRRAAPGDRSRRARRPRGACRSCRGRRSARARSPPRRARRHSGRASRRSRSRPPSRAPPCAARSRWSTGTSGPAGRVFRSFTPAAKTNSDRSAE